MSFVPLKNKKYAMNMGEPSQMTHFHIDEDIRSAVEWLKNELSTLDDGHMYLAITLQKKIIDKVDLAFSDVVKKDE